MREKNVYGEFWPALLSVTPRRSRPFEGYANQDHTSSPSPNPSSSPDPILSHNRTPSADDLRDTCSSPVYRNVYGNLHPNPNLSKPIFAVVKSTGRQGGILGVGAECQLRPHEKPRYTVSRCFQRTSIKNTCKHSLRCNAVFVKMREVFRTAQHCRRGVGHSECRRDGGKAFVCSGSCLHPDSVGCCNCSAHLT